MIEKEIVDHGNLTKTKLGQAKRNDERETTQNPNNPVKPGFLEAVDTDVDFTAFLKNARSLHHRLFGVRGVVNYTQQHDEVMAFGCEGKYQRRRVYMRNARGERRIRSNAPSESQAFVI